MANPKWKEWTEPDKLILLQGWARNGLTEEQITHNMGINRTTLYKWKQAIKDDKDPRIDIFNAIKKGREVCDFEVENALYKSALGFYVQEEEEIFERDPDTGLMGVGKKRVTRKYVQPSNTAQIFWLKNRVPDAWKDKREQVEDVHNEVKVEFAGELADYAD